MQVAVLGAGALGRILGVRLAASGGVGVDFVVRPSRLEDGSIWIERVHGGSDVLSAPSYVSRIPEHADVVLVCVRADQLGEDVVSMLRAGPVAPVVVVTPMLPRTFERLRAELGDRVSAALPNVTGYTAWRDGQSVTRYWVSRASPMLIDEPRTPEPALTGLVTALAAAGIDAQLELAAHEITAATVIAFLPLLLGLDAAGSLDGLLGDGPLLDLTFRACAEARALAERSGKIARWAAPFFRFLGPYTARMGVALGRRRSPEVMAFVADRFGRSARAQNVSLAREAIALAGEKRVPHEELSALFARLS